MALPNSFASAMESAASQMSSTPAETPDVMGQASQQPEQTPEGQAGNYIGLPSDQPEAGQAPQENAPEPSGAISLTVTPETVIGTSADGKPITAQEVQSGYLRQADYTRKTQELAESRQEVDTYLPFIQENITYLEDLASGDQSRITSALNELAETFGVQLGQPTGPARGPDGRFTSSQQSSGLFEIDEYDTEDVAEFKTKANEAFNALSSRFESLEQKHGAFIKGLEQQMTQSQMQAQAESIASSYEQAGFKSVDTPGALAMVGKSITVEQAMKLHHFENILRHNVQVATRRTGGAPNEPEGVPRQRDSLAGKSLSEAFDLRTRA